MQLDETEQDLCEECNGEYDMKCITCDRVLCSECCIRNGFKYYGMHNGDENAVRSHIEKHKSIMEKEYGKDAASRYYENVWLDESLPDATAEDLKDSYVPESDSLFGEFYECPSCTNDMSKIRIAFGAICEFRANHPQYSTGDIAHVERMYRKYVLGVEVFKQKKITEYFPKVGTVTSGNRAFGMKC